MKRWRYCNTRISIKDLRDIIGNINSKRKENIKWCTTLDKIVIWHELKEIEFTGSSKNKKAWDYLQNL